MNEAVIQWYARWLRERRVPGRPGLEEAFAAGYRARGQVAGLEAADRLMENIMQRGKTGRRGDQGS